MLGKKSPTWINTLMQGGTPAVLKALLSLGLVLFALVFSQPLQAQSSDVIALWESDIPPQQGWTVGDPITLRLRVIVPEDTKVTLPEMPAQWGDFEIREQIIQSPVTEAGKTTHILAVTAVLWSPGDHVTPPTTVEVPNAAGEITQVPARTLTVTIASVLAEVTPNAEGQIEKKDLKPQATISRPPTLPRPEAKSLWPWIVAGGVVLLLYFVGRWLWQRLQSRALVAETAPVDDRYPEEIAYEKLEHIAALDLPAQGKFKQHYTLLTECARAYIEGRYGVPALDSTTYELMADLREQKLERDALHTLRDLLDQADLVKFAKFQPAKDPAYAALAQARHFVDLTKPDREPEITEDKE